MFEFNGTFIVAMLSFVVFLLIMNAIFYRPILNIIRKRDEYINTNYEDSKLFEKTARFFEHTHAKKLEETQNVCRKDFKSAIEKARVNAAEKITQAKEVNKIEIQTRKDNLAKDEAKLKNTVQTSVVTELASLITEKFTNGVTK